MSNRDLQDTPMLEEMLETPFLKKKLLSLLGLVASEKCIKLWRF